ncbi:hypothetical protein TRICI_006888 [Trichomonascus ciferrii]|uniref:Uncharacterized protein n=1 Tax=Trichomonascus ciferrii TaxID=44093 RepID=A0A6A1LJS8_9ASCO|nr:hypothetical protein TRICI_006888 [Trichomonascus ciferrii]
MSGDFRKRASGDSNGTLTPTRNSNSNGNNGLASHSNSFLNLTNSALSGVFGSQVSLAELTGDVSNAPSRRPSTGDLQSESKESSSSSSGSGGGRPVSAVSLATSIATLFGFGVAYGQLSRHLHDNHQVTSYTLDIDQTGAFSLLWGSQGIVLGFLFPLFDWLYPEKNRKWSRGKGGADWSSIIRSVAAFMGVAYGIRKLSWTSTLQAAFYWGMVNPCLWFILDATRNGFILSCLTAIVGTTVFALIFPNHLPAPGLSEEYVSVTVWVASVFFCCSICFGNTGRRLLSFPDNSSVDYDDEK